MPVSPADPLDNLIRRIRRPAALRDIMASCLRHVYMGDPFAGKDDSAVDLPADLRDQVRVQDVEVAHIRCALYTPVEMQGPLPLLLYMHGGGFVVGCSEDTDYVTRTLCLDNQLAVVSVNYGLAPENVFPSAIGECLQALNWAREYGASFGIDTAQIFLAGDSAGGNLATAVALKLREEARPASGLVLFAPWLDMQVENYPSYNLLAADGTVFDAPFIAYARAAYVPFEDWKNPLASPILSRASDLPPAIIIAGTADPLFEQSAKFVSNARSEGFTHIELAAYDGMPHCFYSFPGLFEQELDSYLHVSKFLNRLVTH